jgi:outer membrane protein TolC
LYADTWTAYADAYWSGALLRDAQAHLSEMDRVVESARARYSSGRGRMEELLQAQAERAAADADVEDFGAESRGARATLDALRGLPPGGAGETLEAPPEPAVPTSPAPWLAVLDETHPRLAMPASEARRYRLEAASARRMTWPDLDLRFGYGFRSTLADGTSQDDMFSASVGVMLPLFAAGRDGAMGRQMDAMARSRDEDGRAERLALERDLTRAHADAIAASRTATLLKDGVLVLRAKALDAAWSAYGAGVSDLGGVLEQSHAYWNDQIRLMRTRQQLAHAQARALELAGRGEPFGLVLPPFEEETR